MWARQLGLSVWTRFNAKTIAEHASVRSGHLQAPAYAIPTYARREGLELPVTNQTVHIST